MDINIKGQLLQTLKEIDRNIDLATSDEEHAILLNAKATTLFALQKYEGIKKDHAAT